MWRIWNPGLFFKTKLISFHYFTENKNGQKITAGSEISILVVSGEMSTYFDGECKSVQ